MKGIVYATREESPFARKANTDPSLLLRMTVWGIGSPPQVSADDGSPKAGNAQDDSLNGFFRG
jgi:hypothetical protein